MKTDVLIVGGGPAGLSTAYRLKTLRPNLTVTLLEKGPEIGSHLLSGAVFDPRGLDALMPEWRQDPTCPIAKNAVNRDEFLVLTSATKHLSLPWLPRIMRNDGNFTGSLSQLGRWLGAKCENVGVDVFPGVSGQGLIMQDDKVLGIHSNDVGRDRDGHPTANFQPGLDIHANLATILAEGAHGHLSKQVIDRFGMRRDCQHQTYALGLKEVWQADRQKVPSGLVMHTLGWPLNRYHRLHRPQGSPGGEGRESIYGGGFLYTFPDLDNAEVTNVTLGLVIALDYANPYVDLYREFQLWKTHPQIRRHLEEPATCVAYGARVLTEGGWQSLPRLRFPGGLLVGCAAGLVNVPRVKGTHNAILSGMLAADSLLLHPGIDPEKATGHDPDAYDEMLRTSSVGKELYAVRNVRPGFHRFGFWGGLANAGLTVLLGGREPWTLRHGPPDHATLKDAADCVPVDDYPRADGRLTFDLLTNVARTGVMHREGQPSHLLLTDPTVEGRLHYHCYAAGPESRFCPAGVYEYSPTLTTQHGGVGANDDEDQAKFIVNAQNCIHCKACDIKCPSQNITWVTPEGGGGPKYTIT
jgi:electron-transferring-flavoprotein dehydrogenase